MSRVSEVEYVDGNLLWNARGEVWAHWTVAAPTYQYLSDVKKRDYFRRTSLMLQGLPAKSMLLSLCCSIDGYSLQQEMADIAGWAPLSVARSGQLAAKYGVGYTRHYFVAACLAGSSQSFSKLASRSVERAFGVKRLPPSKREVASRRLEMEQLGVKLSALEMKESTAGEVNWMLERSTRRGIGGLQIEGDSGDGGLCNAGTVDATVSELRTKLPTANNFVKVDSDVGESFQTFLAVSGFPVDGWQYPGSEWLAFLDMWALPVDWCIRLRFVDNASALSKASRRKKNLFSQDNEYYSPEAVPASLKTLQESIDELESSLDSDPVTRLVEASIFLSVTERSEAELVESVGLLRERLRDFRLQAHAPIGGQTALFKSCLVGSGECREVRDYKHYLLVDGLASMGPFAGGVKVGSPGFIIGASSREPVTFWQGHGPREGRAANVLSLGDMGSGKSTGTKVDLANTLLAGGQVVVVDQTGTDTRNAEYVTWAHGLPREVSTSVVQLGEGASHSVDPMQVFADQPQVLKEHTVTFLLQLVGAGTLGSESALAGHAVDAALREHGRQARLVNVLEELVQSDKSEARELGEKLTTNYADAPYSQMVFGQSQPVSLNSDLIIFDMPGLVLPTDKDLSNDTLSAQIEPAKRFSQAILYLVASIARKVVFKDLTRFAVLNIDEASYFLRSPAARDLIANIQRASRRTNSCVALATQSPGDNFDGLEKFFTAVFCYKPTSAADARKCLQLLELEESDELVEELMQLRVGECLMQDGLRRVGKVQRHLDPDVKLVDSGASNPVQSTG